MPTSRMKTNPRHHVIRTVGDLPRDHLFRLIFPANHNDSESDEDCLKRRWYHVVKWDEVSRRLKTAQGRTEAREWIQFGSIRRLFFHCLFKFDFGQYSIASKCSLRLVQEAYDAYSDAIRLPDSMKQHSAHLMLVPAHKGGARRTWNHENANVFRWVISTHPDALYAQDKEGQTPLHGLIQMSCNAGTPALLNCVKYLANADPSVILLQDSRNCMEHMFAGDALDYACRMYVENLRGIAHISNAPPLNDYTSFNIHIFELRRIYSCEKGTRTLKDLDMIVFLLRALSEGRPFLPLHAFVRSSICRPWHLVVMMDIVARFGRKGASKVDSSGNLPLHLFLESCMVSRERALNFGFSRNKDEYKAAVVKCFEVILAANRNAAKMMNGEGRHPLHVAIESCPALYGGIIEPLLDLAPRSLLARDMKTRLYPFAAAAIGADADLDTAYNLLRRDPSVLNRYLTTTRARRKRKNLTYF